MPLTGLEVIALLILIALVLGAYRIIHAIKPFIVNAVVGLLVLVLASWFGFGVEITPFVLLVVAIGGIPGAILVLLLAYLGVAFTLI